MSSIPAGRAAVRSPDASESWFSALGVKGRRAFRAAYAGYMLDAFDLIVLTLSLSAIGATFSVGTGATGALSTVTLSASAVGGILGGVLADRIGRARTLMLSVAVYSVFTFLSGLATSYGMLMVFRVFQGIGFGAEWGVGAVLVAELVRPESRGQRARDHPERVGRGLGAGGRRLPDRVRAVPRADRVARADVPRDPAGDPDPLHPLAGRGPGGLQGGALEGRVRRGAAQADPAGKAAEDDDRGLAPRHRHPGRLLRDVHLDPDVSQGGARPHDRRHVRATCSW